MSGLSAVRGVKSVLVSNFFVKLPIPEGSSELSDQVMIVTGANTGLGFEASQHLSRLGLGKLIMAVRTPAKGEAARSKILEATGRAESSIAVWPMDMDSFESIQAFAARASAELPRLDGVLANAGIMTTRWLLSEGSEKSLHVNVVATFLLLVLLLPQMRASGRQTGHACRFVVPNSALHYMAPLAELQPGSPSILARLNDEKQADMAGRYALTKLLVLYGVREFAERTRGSEKGSCIINTPNPSFCKSNLANESADGQGFKVFEKILARSTEEGSRALVHGLLAGPDTNGQYLSNCKVEIPSCNVTGKWGQQVQKRFFDELLEKFEQIQPGISANL